MIRRIVPAAAAALLLTGCGKALGQTQFVAAPIIPEETAAPTEPVTEAATEPPTEAPTEPELSPAEKKLAEMSLHEKVCQMFIVTPEELTGYERLLYSDDWLRSSFEQYPVGGFIFFACNIDSSDQTRTLLSDIQQNALNTGIGAFMAVDEEGGSITRVHQQLGTESVSSMSWYGQQNDYSLTRSAGATIGTYLAEYGFNVDFAPVADVNISQFNELGSRIFSSDPSVVGEMSAAFVEGLHSAGVCSTLKHFPGLGAGSGNTHYGTVIIERSCDELMQSEFPAFLGGIAAGTDFVMVGHQVTSASQDSLPGDLSPVVVSDWLRGTLDFGGIAVTDSHSMGAIVNVYETGEAAVMAVEAGIDVILMPRSISAAVEGIESAVGSGRIPAGRIDESVLRILTKKDELGLLNTSADTH